LHCSSLADPLLLFYAFATPHSRTHNQRNLTPQ
jgi:hypothetical protein